MEVPQFPPRFLHKGFIWKNQQSGKKKIGGGGNFLQYMFEIGGVLPFSPTFTPHPNRLRNQNNPDHPINGLYSVSTKRPSSFITVHLVGHWSINQQSNSKNEHANQSVPEKKEKKKIKNWRTRRDNTCIIPKKQSTDTSSYSQPKHVTVTEIRHFSSWTVIQKSRAPGQRLDRHGA